MDAEAESPLRQFVRIEAQVQLLLREVSLQDLSRDALKQLDLIRRGNERTRSLLKEYESQENTATMSRLLQQAVGQLETLKKYILDASEHGVFSAADVAFLTAHLEQLIERLE